MQHTYGANDERQYKMKRKKSSKGGVAYSVTFKSVTAFLTPSPPSNSPIPS